MGEAKRKRALKRSCGDCQLCCELLPVRELGKVANERCQHQCSAGCGVYHTAGFPRSCGVWSCLWLTDLITPVDRRPDLAGYCVDPMPDFIKIQDNQGDRTYDEPVMQIWCDPARPDAWRDPALLNYLTRVNRQAKLRTVIVRYSSKDAIVLLYVNNEWVVNTGHQTISTTTKTGSFLLDKIIQEATHAS